MSSVGQNFSQYIKKIMSVESLMNNHTNQHFKNEVLSHPELESNNQIAYKIIKILSYYDTRIESDEIFVSIVESESDDIFNLIFYDLDFKHDNSPLTHLLKSLILCQIKSQMSCGFNSKKELVVFHLIRKMISLGVLSNNSQSYDNTFSLAIETQNIDIIYLILELNPKPHNPSDTLSSDIDQSNITLNQAVKTRNLQIVRIATHHGALPNNNDSTKCNTLYCAFINSVEHNISIIYQIVAFNASYNFDMTRIIRAQKIYKWDTETMIQIINIVLCCGKIEYIRCCVGLIDDPLIKRKMWTIIEFNKQINKRRFAICYYKDDPRSSKLDVINLIEELNEMTEKLIKRSDEKISMIYHLSQGIAILPRCLIDVIFEYIWIPSTIKKKEWKCIDEWIE